MAYRGDLRPDQQPKETPRRYRVLKEAHITDERGRSQFYPVDEHIELRPTNARYWVMEGVLSET